MLSQAMGIMLKRDSDDPKPKCSGLQCCCKIILKKWSKQ